jgi:hypothetical protein
VPWAGNSTSRMRLTLMQKKVSYSASGDLILIENKRQAELGGIHS